MTEYVHPTPFMTHVTRGPYGEAQAAYSYSTGMTLRDYFAAQALAGILANNTASYPEWNANRSYEHADAMLKARGGGEIV